MLDRYWWGSVNRISPEAPVPIVNLNETTVKLGGAANVAANVAGLGATAFLVGLTGTDEESALFDEELKNNEIKPDYIIKSANRRTIVKTRIVAHSQQIVRIDQESKAEMTAAEEKFLWKTVSEILDQVQVVIVSDYAKGSISENFMSRLITATAKKQIPVMVDPKGRNYKKYRKAMILTPNRYELSEICHLEDYEQTTLEKAGKKLLSELALESLLITLGEDGLILLEKQKPSLRLPVTARKVYDVTGAGDTVIASLAVAFSSGESLPDAARFANKCAGLVVEQIGTTAISRKMLGEN